MDGDTSGVLCVERYGTRRDLHHSVYVHDRETGKIKLRGEVKSTSSSFFRTIKAIFLPQGYPESVSEDYFEYQVWDTIQAFCSSITGALATQAVLKGSGVGDETASIAGATITWLLKDGTGMVGRIAFAYFKGASLDRDAKKWRLFADILNDCAIFVTLIAPLFPKEYFTIISCLAGLAFSLVGVAGGCTRAALTMHQAKRNNMADVSAKDGSQETLVNLFALMINMILIPVISGNISLTWILFAIFTFFHILANYKAVTCVVMNTFNYARFKIVFDHCYLNPGMGEILLPEEANKIEPIISGHSDSWINVGCKLDDLEMESIQFTKQLSLNPNVKVLSRYKDQKGVYLASLRDSSTATDMISAYYEAETKKNSSMLSRKHRVHFVEELGKYGWDISRHQLRVDEWRWSTEEMDKIK